MLPNPTKRHARAFLKQYGPDWDGEDLQDFASDTWCAWLARHPKSEPDRTEFWSGLINDMQTLIEQP